MADLTKEQHIENINKVIKGVKYAMMTTITADEKHLHACPMTTNKKPVKVFGAIPNPVGKPKEDIFAGLFE